MDKKTILGLVAAAILIAAAMVYLPFPAGPVGAQSETEANELRGWAWSGVTGWVSFNSDDYDASGVDYKVEVDESGNLTGYAWSLYLGWIKFASGLYPTSLCDGDCHGARLEGNDLKGWARVCSVYQSGCDGTLRSAAELGGWDGWIKMDNVTRQANGAFHGYAWGDLNLAWLNFGFGDDNDDNDDCNPQEEVCGGEGDDCNSEEECCSDDTYETNPEWCLPPGDNQVSVVVTGYGCDNSTVSFNPPGLSCGESCREYPTGEYVTVTFTEQIPDSVSGCPADGYTKSESEGICEIPNIETNYTLMANCNTTDISVCKPKFTSGVPLTLSEDLYTTYPALSNSGIGKLDLLDSSGNSCVGITYRLESEAYKLINGIKGDIDSNVTLACREPVDQEYLPDNCSSLTGGTTVNVKAYFTSRPVDRAAKWSLEMTAHNVSDDSPSQTFNITNQLIQYFARTGAR